MHCHIRGRAVAALAASGELCTTIGDIARTLTLMAAILARSRGEGGA